MLRKSLFLLVLFLCLSFGIQGQYENRFSQNVVNKEVQISNTSNINTAGLEFSPVIYENALVYVSRRKNGLVDQKTQETFFELFYAELDPNGIPVKALNFSNELNSQLHEGPVTFNKRGDKIYFTRSNLDKGLSRADKKGRVGLKIYEAERGYYDWENITELPFNDDEYSCMHPSLSADGKKLFFSSNMPNGYGGMDLYFVEKKDEKWSKPINLGSAVNSNKNEVFPFIHESGTLFFTSNGHNSMGGLDIFMININDRRWGRVTNLGVPFNSEKDDLGLILDPKGTQGYFASNREGGRGGDDIYIFDAPLGLRGITQPELIGTPVVVYDGDKNKKLTGASIYIYEITSKGLLHNEELFDLKVLSDEDETKEVLLKLVRKKDSALGRAKNVTDKNGESIVHLEANKKYLILATKPDYTAKEIEYTAPDKPSNGVINITLERSNCLTLNGKVTTTVNSMGIPNVSILVINKCNQSEEIIKTNVEGYFSACLPFGCDFEIKAQRKGFSTANSRISTAKLRGSRSMDIEMEMKPQSELTLIGPIKKGSVIVLNNIYYDFNKSAIRKGAAPDLDALARLMKRYPSLEIELGAHTDSRGTDRYNQELSFKRAESAKQFLINKGISTNRIRAFGYGESFIRNHCKNDVDCTEEEHENNRRTEVKVIKINEGVEDK